MVFLYEWEVLIKCSNLCIMHALLLGSYFLEILIARANRLPREVLMRKDILLFQ